MPKNLGRRSSTPQGTARGTTTEWNLPDKLYFKIGEVAQLLGVEGHVLRYWEREISLIKPAKSDSNQRRYRRRDVELFYEIRRLLHEEGYTLAGVRRRLLSGQSLDSVDGATTLEPSETESLTLDEPVLQAVKSKANVAPRKHLCESTTESLSESTRAKLKAGLIELILLTGEQP